MQDSSLDLKWCSLSLSARSSIQASKGTSHGGPYDQGTNTLPSFWRQPHFAVLGLLPWGLIGYLKRGGRRYLEEGQNRLGAAVEGKEGAMQ